ncbi:coat protein [Army ant associated cyclovirus 1]|uniref:Coat protein n=1 Tax=army ant associated cyclovirus 1 P21/23-reste_1 TaxID=3070161 RepID=A0AA49E4P2_9CIRC|nr:coat protein [Army ant associated cyclovirus 1]WBG01471.1 coat protein [army ant associated cyclovirus 1 P21/23-reste_1]
MRRRTIRRRRVIRRRVHRPVRRFTRVARRRLARRRLDVHTYRWTAPALGVIVGDSAGPQVNNFTIQGNDLPISITGATVSQLYSHWRIKKAVFRLRPTVNVNAMQPTPLVPPEIVSTQWYAELPSVAPLEIAKLEMSPMLRYHHWARPFRRVLYPKVLMECHGVQTGSTTNTVGVLKKAGWFTTTNLDAGGTVLGMLSVVSRVACQPTNWFLERTFTFQLRRK